MYSSAQSPFLYFIISTWNWEAFLQAVLFLLGARREGAREDEVFKSLVSYTYKYAIIGTLVILCREPDDGGIQSMLRKQEQGLQECLYLSLICLHINPQ